LKNIDFKVEQGDVVGIIGKNGAGKSTLLKLLSRVTGPTVGEIRARGRIGSLLEVGTGFHPEMTGRENIFMNGAIMGRVRSFLRGMDVLTFTLSNKAHAIGTYMGREPGDITPKFEFNERMI